MDAKERQDMIDSLYPVGQERWIKIKFHDQDKAMKAFRWYGTENDQSRKFIEEHGYELTALSFREEYKPQMAAILDLKEEIIGSFYSTIQTEHLERINNLFKHKLEELQRNIIQTKPLDGVNDQN